MSLESLAQALHLPLAYPHPAAQVEERVASRSSVFLAGEMAYKVFHPVQRGRIDLSTLEARRAACEAELEVNRRYAASTYRQVVPIARDDEGRIAIQGAGQVIEHALEMRRLADADRLDVRLAADAVDGRALDAVARALHRAHASEAVDRSAVRTDRFEAFARRVLERAAAFAREPALSEAGGLRVLSVKLHGYLTARVERFLQDERAVLHDRAHRARDRRLHGDLRAEHVSLGSGGVTFYAATVDDREDLGEARRLVGDVAYDLASLAVDLDRRGEGSKARLLARRYASVARDRTLERVLPVHELLRAVELGARMCEEAADTSVAPARRWSLHSEATRMFQLAAGYALPAALVVTCGLPATGKTTLARHLAAPFDAVVLTRRPPARARSAHGRRRNGGDAGDAGDAARRPSSVEARRGDYAELLARALDELDATGEGAEASGAESAPARSPSTAGREPRRRFVVVDAEFSQRAERERFVEGARAAGVPVFLVWVRTQRGDVVKRLGEDAPAVARYDQRAKGFAPPVDFPIERRVDTETAGAPERVVSRLIDRMVDAAGLADGSDGAGGEPAGGAAEAAPDDSLEALP